MSSLSVLLWGSDPLALDIARILIAAGHRVAAVVGRSPDLGDWAEAQGTVVLAPDAAALVELDADWLVATDPEDPPPPLGLARRGAVRFATDPGGAHPARSAILAGAAQVGLAWRLGDDDVAVVQAMVEVAADATAADLAGAIAAAARDSLPALVEALGKAEPPLHPLPRSPSAEVSWTAATCVIDGTAETEAVLRLVRALDGSDAPALPMLLQGAGALIVGSAEPAAGHGTPGEVLESGEGAVVVATADGAVRLSGLVDAVGAPAPLPRPGTRLLGVGPDAEATTRAARAGEAAWRARFADWRPARCGVAPGPGGPPWSRALPLPAGIPMPAVLAAFPALVCALQGGGAVDLALGRGAAVPGATLGWVPLRFDPATGWAAASEALAAEVAKLSAAPPLAADLPARLSSVRAGGMTRAALSLDGPVDGAAMTLAFGEGELRLHADPRLVAPAEAALMAERLRHLLGHLAAPPPETEAGTAIAGLPILPEAERELVLFGWNATDATFDAEATLHGLIAAQAARAPEAPAVSCRDLTLGYDALDRQANRLAHRLRDLGAAPGIAVGLHLPRSVERVAAMLGILKAGAAILPLDPGAETTAPRLGATGTSLVVCGAGDGPWPGVRCLQIDDPDLAQAPDTAPADEATGDDLAFLVPLPESGDGAAAMVEHRNVTSLLAGLAERIATEAPVWLALGGLADDSALIDVLGALAGGGHVVVADAPEALDPPARPQVRAIDLSLAVDATTPWPELRATAARAETDGAPALWLVGDTPVESAVALAAALAATTALDLRAIVVADAPARLAAARAALDLVATGRARLVATDAGADAGAACRIVGVDPADWRNAAEAGHDLLVVPDELTPDDLARRLADYRQELARCGHDAARRVTLLLTATVGDGDDAEAEETWRLAGTEAAMLAEVQALAACGVDEIACRFDAPAEPHLARLRQRLAELAVAEPEDHSLPALIARHRISHLACGPELADRLLRHDAARDALGGLRQVVIGGGPVPGALVAALAAASDAAIEVVRGWPETTPAATSQPGRTDQEANAIGAPMANGQAYVLDDRLQPCPVGVAGELWIGGAGVGRGYWRRDDLTAERFRPDPFRRGGRLFRTGALARWRCDGTLDMIDAGPDPEPAAQGRPQPEPAAPVADDAPPDLTRLIALAMERP